MSLILDAGKWLPTGKFEGVSGYEELKKVKRFFRVGIVLGMPWAWVNGSDHPVDSKSMSDELPLRGLTGYCIDLLTRLADKDHMDFDFEIVPATNVRFSNLQSDLYS